MDDATARGEGAIAVPRGRLALVAVALVAALAFAACGADDEGAGEARTPAAGAIRLEATEFAFDPSQVTVAPGEQEFEIVNRGEVEHALTIDASGGETSTDRVGPGESASLTATLSEPGTYELYCPVADHRERGMTGTLRVEKGAPRESVGEDAGGGGAGGY